VICWGTPLWNETGRKPGPTEVPTITGVEELVLGDEFACARCEDGRVWCFGSLDGDAPSGTSKNTTATPVAVTDVSDATALVAGSHHACALRAGGTVWCWAADWGGQLGNGHRSQHAGPHPVVGLTDAIALHAGRTTTCAARKNGEVDCWGFDEKFRELTGGDRPRRATRVFAEPDPWPVAQASPDCPYGPLIEISMTAREQELVSAGEDEDKRAQILARLGMPAVPLDREPEREEDLEPYHLEFAETRSNLALTAPGKQDLLV
jgi:hypothetical protein